MKRAALFVGVNDYIKPLASLKCARKDADTLYGLFLKEYSSGMVDYLHDVNSDEIICSIEKTMAQLEEGDLFFFYFSGHGIEERNNHFLLTAGARQFGDEWQHALSVNKLRYLTKKRGVQTVIVIDSCRESVYAGARSVIAAEQSRGATMKKVVDEGVKEADFLPPVILCSCAGGERAFEIEESGHGLFTLALKECLEDGKLSTFDEIANDVTKRLKALVQKYNFTGHQTPEVHKAPSVNPVLWGDATVKKAVKKTPEVDNSKLIKEYGKLYGKAETILENGRFDWKEEYKARLESCERIYEGGLVQEALTALNDLSEWHKMKKRDNVEAKRQAEQKRFGDEIRSIEEKWKKRDSEAQRQAEQKRFDEEIRQIEKKWHVNETCQKEEKKKQPAKDVKQAEPEKKLSIGQRILYFFFDYVVSILLLILTWGAVMDKSKFVVIPLGLYIVLLFARKHWYFVLCNIFAAALCLTLHNPWWWLAVVGFAFVIFCIICSDEVSSRIKRCSCFYVYLSLLQAIPVSSIRSNDFDTPLFSYALCGSLFFPLMYSFPKATSCAFAIICGIHAVTWTGWWWIGVVFFLLAWLVAWADQDEKKDKEGNTVQK